MDQELVNHRGEGIATAIRSWVRWRTTAWFAAFGFVVWPLAETSAGVGDNPDVEVVYQFNLAPSVLTAASDGSWVMGLDQAEKPQFRAVRVRKATEVKPFPTEAIALADPSAPVVLDAVEALQTDEDGIIWLLDNGRRSEMPPKLVAWDDDDERVKMVRVLAVPATVPGSFVSDFVIDPDSPLAILSDPANGTNAALILLDRETGVARRVLEGHPSVVPDPSVAVRLPRGMTVVRRLDGAAVLPHSGVRPLALDRKAEWLYFAAVQSRQVHRLPMKLLRRADVTAQAIAEAVESYAVKPPCSSFVMDGKGNLHLGDIEARAIGVIEPVKRTYRVIASDARLLWPDGLCFGQDGRLYFFSRLLMPSGTKMAGAPALPTLHSLFRIKPVAEGRAGD